ncbi:hypothetical protein T265_03441 [Opisthorchis viverrini]|uniref:Uncharacterized protein n=1 Tax=Opisthorchis viverrini TaxID=6198 RepID=A0A075A3C4_OPIVI|nr:hypothetical protein T265_03441 [Opisthorchis viverrini]KER30070.1 hypothetical protein T265_03441 [Opisthorchis viverrini]
MIVIPLCEQRRTSYGQDQQILDESLAKPNLFVTYQIMMKATGVFATFLLLLVICEANKGKETVVDDEQHDLEQVLSEIEVDGPEMETQCIEGDDGHTITLQSADPDFAKTTVAKVLDGRGLLAEKKAYGKCSTCV